VRLGLKMPIHYFACSCGPDTVFIKSALGHFMPNLCFASVRYAGHIVHSVASGP
jgi:hypothetical protein